MEEKSLRRLLENVASGYVAVENAVAELRDLPFADLGFAKIDHHRELRMGLPETIYCPGKSPDQIVTIVGELLAHDSGVVMATRATLEQAEAILETYPDASFDELSRLIVVKASTSQPDGIVVVVAAGTSDLPVAREAYLVAQALGLKVEILTDVGVAGIHRLISSRRDLDSADAVIVVAGMEGALASVVAGLISVPVIAVPTSVGYGAGEGGIAPLLTMLNSCAPGIAVVNIDNGYGAAVFAHTMLRSRTADVGKKD